MNKLKDKQPHNISARSARVITIKMMVYDMKQNERIYYGDVESCKKLEATNHNLIAVSL